MGATLALVGCGPRLEIGISSPALPAPALVALAGTAPRNELIIEAVDLLLRGAALGRAEIDTIVVTRGPGSFTGVRVALATAQGLALALGASARAFPSLQVQAARASDPIVLAVQPARRGHAYCQRFARQDGTPREVGEIRLAAIAELTQSDIPVVGPAGFPLGPGAPAAHTSLSAAEALLELAASCSDASALVPIYVDPPPVTPPTHGVKAWPRSHKAS